MSEIIIEFDEASVEREQQRSESEARDIIHDIQKLYTFPEEKKTRWVWELFQNAKDVAPPDGVEIRIALSPFKIDFSHTGIPFKTKHLLAILYKTSTKSLNGEGGTTGKYGTGFVTTHLLNRKVNIAGVHENSKGRRRFEIEIDRTSANLEEDQALAAMQDSLAVSFRDVSSITKIPSQNVTDFWNTFSYDLKSSYVYAERGLLELERNLAFTLLINEPKIKSVVVTSTFGKKTYAANKMDTFINGVSFISLDEFSGLLYHKSGKVTFGIPAKKEEEGYSILPIENQAVLYKEFPLIGTEFFNLPVFIQHDNFHPTEQRDGIRTKMASDEEPDPIAEKNRKALIEFIESYIPFIEKLIDLKLPGSYHFAKSGLPALIEVFSNITWYEEYIQRPIRTKILEKAIVRTCDGLHKTIEESKFILGTEETDSAFFELVSKLVPDQIPSKDSIWHWSQIISQEPDRWPENIILGVEDMVKLVQRTIDLKNDGSFAWLNDLYRFLEMNGLSHLGEHYYIYPNEAGNFCIKDDLSLHPEIDDAFKFVSKGLGRPLDKEFLNRKIGKLDVIKTFDLQEFYKQLNNVIQELKIELATEEQITSIFYVCCLFRSDRAYRRESWFNIINQLLPAFAPEKKYITVDYENYGRSAELWSIKYVCHLLEKKRKPSLLAEEYFEGNIDVCFKWLNDFLAYVFGLQDEQRDVVQKRQIIPVQNDEFKSYEDYIFSEQDSNYFDDVIKNIYRDFTGKGDPRRFIIDNRISFDGIRRQDVDVLTNVIDQIFDDQYIDSKVKKGGDLNEMFLQLNDWFERFSNASTLLRGFSNKRATLYVLALGEGFSKQIMEIRNSGKSMDDLTEMAKMKLTAQEMKVLDLAAVELGSFNLMNKAQEMLDAKHQMERWKKIGAIAEKAFFTALSQAEPTFEILNPDRGKDFVIKANEKEYAIEIKSVDALKGNVNMSLKQGQTAVIEKDQYSLCVLSRPADDGEVDINYFINESRFVPTIGYQIGGCIDDWNKGLSNLNTNAEVKVSLDEKTESVYVSRNIWKAGISFNDFIVILKNHFE